MKLRFLALGFVLGCAGSQEQLPPERASDPSYWLQELRDDAHPDQADRAVVIRRYLDLAPAETKAELGKLTAFLTPCTQRFRLAGTLHQLERFDSAIEEYRRVSADGCDISAAEIARRIAFASVEAKPDEYPSQQERLNAYLDKMLELERAIAERARGEVSYEIAVVQHMVGKPDAARLHALADRALAQMASGKPTDIEGVLRTIVIIANSGGAALADVELLKKAAQGDNFFHGRFGYSVL